MRAARVLPGLCLLVVGLFFGTVGAQGDDAETTALVKTLLSAQRPALPAAEAQLRRRGVAALAALRAARKAASPEGRGRLDRVLAQITEDVHRRAVPDGMVYVPAGALEVPRERPPWGPSGQRIQVPAFYLDRTEVTVAAWRAWLADRAAVAPGAPEDEALPRPPADADGRLPMTGVRWAEAERFARAARGGRLPTAEEFERALRGAGTSTWPWGDEPGRDRANLQDQGPGAPVPVGRHPGGAGPFGCLDLVGNVAEWSATVVRQGGSGRYPLLLGGSFRQRPDPALTWRGLDRMQARIGPRERHAWVGFRVARDVPKLPE